MKAIEFYLKENVPEHAFDVLCNGFFSIPSPFARRVDGEVGSAVFSVSSNPETSWVQLLIDEDTPAGILAAIRSKAQGLSGNGHIAEYDSEEGLVEGETVQAPIERPRLEVGV